MLEVTEPTDTIVLNAKELDVERRRAVVQGGRHGRTTALKVDPDLERIVITTDQPLDRGRGHARPDVRGRDQLGPARLLPQHVTSTRRGDEQVLAATQFEAPHARAAFPCFDEPEFKAVFAVTLVVADDLLALSNGPEIAREVADGNVRVRFGETIPMSTYLVAWVVGPLEVTDPVDAGGVAVRVAHVPGNGHLTQFALDVGAFAITFFADYYGIPYPGREMRPRRAPRLLVRRDGEPRLRHVPRDAPAARSRRRSRSTKWRAPRSRSCTRSRTCGSATS